MTSSTDFAALAERLHSASDEERHALMRSAADDPDAAMQLREAWLILTAAGSYDDIEVAAADDVALELARGRIARSAIRERDDFEWLLATLGPATTSPSPEPGASAATRHALRDLTGSKPAPRFRLGLWLPALGTAAAAAILAVVVLRPAPDPWARQLGLSSARAGSLSEAFADDVERAVTEGTLSPARFEVPDTPIRYERAALATGNELPRPLYPLWENVPDLRPELRWSAVENESYEVMLLDSERKLVWSAGPTVGGRLTYPEARPPLEPGREYFWKVNLLGGEQLVASPYAGFATLEDDARSALETDLSAAGDHAFLRAVALDRQGLYSPALEALDAFAREGPKQQEMALRAREAIASKQGRTP